MVLSLCASACWGSSGGEPWVAPDPPDSWASGLSIDYIPDEFSFVWNEGHETATFHVFQTAEGEQVSVGRQLTLEPYPSAVEQLIRDGREFAVAEGSSETRVLVELADGVRIEVVSQTLDTDTLLRITESVGYDPTRDSQA